MVSGDAAADAGRSNQRTEAMIKGRALASALMCVHAEQRPGGVATHRRGCGGDGGGGGGDVEAPRENGPGRRRLTMAGAGDCRVKASDTCHSHLIIIASTCRGGRLVEAMVTTPPRDRVGMPSTICR